MGRWFFFSMVLGVVCWVCEVGSVGGIGANWGTQTSNPLPPSTVVQMLRDNGFQKVKLFDAEDGTLSALKNSGIEVMVGIPNDMLASLASDMKSAENWVSKNVSGYVSDGVNIRSSSQSLILLFIRFVKRVKMSFSFCCYDLKIILFP